MIYTWKISPVSTRRHVKFSPLLSLYLTYLLGVLWHIFLVKVKDPRFIPSQSEWRLFVSSLDRVPTRPSKNCQPTTLTLSLPFILIFVTSQKLTSKASRSNTLLYQLPPKMKIPTATLLQVLLPLIATACDLPSSLTPSTQDVSNGLVTIQAHLTSWPTHPRAGRSWAATF